MKPIVILAATHEPYDNRVYYKETLSLWKRYQRLTLVAPSGEDFVPAEGVKLIRFEAQGRLSRIKCLYETAKALEIGLCHCHEPDSLLAGVFLKRLKGCKLIYDSHEYHPESFSERFPEAIRGLVRFAMLRFERWMVKQCDYVITVNHDLAAKFTGWGAHVAVLPNYPSPELFSLRQESDEGQHARSQELSSRDSQEFLLTYVGTLAKTRGVLDVLEVARRIKDKGISVRVRIIGASNEPGLQEEIQEFAQKNEIPLDHLGHIPHDQVAQQMRESDAGMLLLHPLERYMKAEPIKLFEYMACALPVISYRYPAVEDIINESQCGEMVEAMDLEAVVEVIKRWAQDEALRQRLGQNGQAAFSKKYNWTVCEEKLWAVYQELGME